MSLRNQFASVVEWDEFRDDMIFWKWKNSEIKRGSKLVIRPGQDAVFIYNGKIEGIFRDDGEYEIDSSILPFLSTLKGAWFGFNSGIRVEVLFVNTKEFTVNWGTRSPIMLQSSLVPGGLPVRANGVFTFKVVDYVTFIENIAGIRDIYLVENVKLRIVSILDLLLMKWISREGQNMYNLQANAQEIAEGIRADLDKQVLENGMTITELRVLSFNYPDEIQDMIVKAAAQDMIGPVQVYQQASMTNAMTSGSSSGGGISTAETGAKTGIDAILEMMDDLQEEIQNDLRHAKTKPGSSPNCETALDEAGKCGGCGYKQS
ncbi:SPFH domain-containing protein [Paenibacillus chibensis]|uniref:SPFH domain-containing protein n=1 Tax=Paenibacillus chibensis TaxID=59846 RepID=UPI000FDBE293|nr:SPFH domain-containing protein [Paenibacillus chibensis]MEC0371781.1 SPFH domain-containing protein [Paenibacillus chibensis]